MSSGSKPPSTTRRLGPNAVSQEGIQRIRSARLHLPQVTIARSTCGTPRMEWYLTHDILDQMEWGCQTSLPELYFSRHACCASAIGSKPILVGRYNGLQLQGRSDGPCAQRTNWGSSGRCDKSQ